MIEWTLPPWDSPEIDRVGLPEAFGRGRDIASDGLEALQARLAAAPDPRHRMFGFPDQIQGDIRWEAELDTIRLAQGPDASVQDAFDAAVPAPDWRLLLQVDSDASVGTRWGDAGSIYYLVRPDALEQRAFGRTWLVAQCY
jgi:uncharacterized protein YwqG